MSEAVRYAMVGGGEGAFIGPVHRTAAAIAGNCRLVAAALSSDPERARRSAEAIGLPSERSYESYAAMIEAEKALPEGERAQFIAIVTPNHVHAGPAIAALEAGFPVICDKPLADTLMRRWRSATPLAAPGVWWGSRIPTPAIRSSNRRATL